MNNATSGTYLRLKYVGRRKRKAVNWGIADERLDNALIRAKEWLYLNKGKFVGGVAMACSFYDVESDGKTIRMQSVPMFSPAHVLENDKLDFLNGES